MMSSKEMERAMNAMHIVRLRIVCVIKLNNMFKAVAGRSLSKSLSVIPEGGLFCITGAGGCSLA
ncbi:MAG: hypothetical protein NT018_04465 [Armatimonadetes bacterium]|nr:hypothetical protein [Armatimonadota bacterium]